HGAADHVLSRNESPITAIKADVAVVAHAKITVRRDDNITILNVIWHRQLPFIDHIRLVASGHCRKIIAVWVVRIESGLVAVVHIGLIQLLAITIDDPVSQMNSVARQSDDALDDVKLRRALINRKKNDDVAMMDLAIRNQRAHPTCARGELHTVHENVVSDE